MSEAIQYETSTSQFTDSLLSLMVRMSAPKGKILKINAPTKSFKTKDSSDTPKEVNLLAVPEPKATFGEKLTYAVESVVVGIEYGFGKAANKIAQNVYIVSAHPRRYTKFLLAWVRYATILLLIYATDNRKKGAALKIAGVHIGLLAGALAGVWGSQVVSSAVPGIVGYVLGLFIGLTLILALVEVGKKLGSLVSFLTSRAVAN